MPRIERVPGVSYFATAAGWTHLGLAFLLMESPMVCAALAAFDSWFGALHGRFGRGRRGRRYRLLPRERSMYYAVQIFLLGAEFTKVCADGSRPAPAPFRRGRNIQPVFRDRQAAEPWPSEYRVERCKFCWIVHRRPA